MPTRYTPDPDVVFKRLGRRMVLLRLSSNHVFELNDTGARVWELLNEGADVEAILARLSSEFDVEPSKLEEDIHNLLEDLANRGLIS